MRIAVTSKGPDLTSEVDRHFGRARCFVVVDTDTGETSTHDNDKNLNAAQGAGIQAGRQIVELGVEAVISGSVGPKAFATLQAGNVQVHVGAKGTVAEAIEDFKGGKLSPATQANAEAHWI